MTVHHPQTPSTTPMTHTTTSQLTSHGPGQTSSTVLRQVRKRDGRIVAFDPDKGFNSAHRFGYVRDNFTKSSLMETLPGPLAIGHVRYSTSGTKTAAIRDVFDLRPRIGLSSAALADRVPLAVVTMVEGTLTHWVRDPAPERDRAEIVSDLATYAWFVIDGAARSVNLAVDPDAQLVDAIAAPSARVP